MTIGLDDLMAKLPKQRRQAIEVRATELMTEDATLRRLREAHQRSRNEVAKTLRTNRAGVSRLEQRTDVYLSTLRGQIEAMGGRLEIIARFPEQDVPITRFETLAGDDRPQD